MNRELIILNAQEPKSCMSANSITAAWIMVCILSFMCRDVNHNY